MAAGWQSCLAVGKARQSTAIYCQAPGLQTWLGGGSKLCLALFFPGLGFSEEMSRLFETHKMDQH